MVGTEKLVEIPNHPGDQEIGNCINITCSVSYSGDSEYILHSIVIHKGPLLKVIYGIPSLSLFCCCRDWPCSALYR